LNDRLVDQRKHFLGLRFGCGQETGAQSCGRKHSFTNFHHIFFIGGANANQIGCCFASKRRAVVPQHCFANDFQWHAALIHELIVKFHEAKIVPAHFTIVLAQFENL
jgi:hypothetical protein